MMRSVLAKALTRLAGWLAPAPAAPVFTPPSAGRYRQPTAGELLAELRHTAWACASLNAAACASFPPRLYVMTRPGDAPPRRMTRALAPDAVARLLHMPRARHAERIEEVPDHPLLDLLQQVNPVHNAFDLWELTTLSLEVHGCAYWLLEPGPLGAPTAIWPLPAHTVTPYRTIESANIVDSYRVRTARGEESLSPDRVIAFRYPDPASPYTAGLSPLRACFDQVRLASELATFKRTKIDNQALPDAIISPEGALGEEERDRLEALWNNRLRKGGAGRVLVAESSLRVQLLEHSLGDLASLADLRATKEDIANAFHVPLAFLTSETNLANLQAAEQQHAAQALRPRLRRRDEKLNEQLVPLFDPSGRLFMASDDPAPNNREATAREHDLYLRHGVLTVNEVRSRLGLGPLPSGDASGRRAGSVSDRSSTQRVDASCSGR